MSFSRKFCDKSPFKQKDEDPNTFKLGLNELGESPVRNRNKYFSDKFPVHKDYNHPKPGFSLYKGKVNFKRFINKFRKK